MKRIIAVILTIMLSGCGVENAQTESVSNNTVSDKGIGWGIKKNENSPPDMPAEITDMIKKYDAFYMDNSGEKTLYLTFDEGYENGYTDDILDILKKEGVPAAFFVTGSYFDREGELVRRMIDEGHIVGNHTENHPNLSKLSDEKIIEELKTLTDKCEKEYGYRMMYMRPPEGEFSERVLSVAKECGYKTAFWSFAYKDWIRDVTIGEDAAFNKIAPYLHDGCVLLLHAVSKDNADVLPRIIKHAKEQGYTFKSLDDIK